jgi:hypothetical protein
MQFHKFVNNSKIIDLFFCILFNNGPHYYIDIQGASKNAYGAEMPPPLLRHKNRSRHNKPQILRPDCNFSVRNVTNHITIV